MHSNKIPSIITFAFTNINSSDPSLYLWEGQCPPYFHFTNDKTEGLGFGTGGGRVLGGQRAGVKCQMSEKCLSQYFFQHKNALYLTLS